jgi:hypothetical protein
VAAGAVLEPVAPRVVAPTRSDAAATQETRKAGRPAAPPTGPTSRGSLPCRPPPAPTQKRSLLPDNLANEEPEAIRHTMFPTGDSMSKVSLWTP